MKQPYNWDYTIRVKTKEETMKCLKETQNQLQQKENIIKEVREKIEKRINEVDELLWVEMKKEDYIEEQLEFLEILDKGE